MESNVTERVKQFMNDKGLTTNRLAGIINVGQPTLSKQLRDGGCGVSLTTLVLLLNTYPDLSAEWLLRGEGDMVKGVVEKDGRGTVKAIGQQDLVDALKDHIATLKADKQRLLNEVDQLRREKSLSDGFGYPMVAEPQAEYEVKK